jgi:DNA-binding NtrC family response regulator
MKNPSLLIIEDEQELRKSIAAYFKDIDYTVFEASDGQEGLACFYREKPHIVFTDLRMPIMDGYGVIADISQNSPETPVIVISGTGVIRDAIEAMKLGAYDYVVKPVHEMVELEHAAKKALEAANLRIEVASLKHQLLSGNIKNQEAFSAIITRSPALFAIFQYIEAIAPTSQSILITGETGTGKELLAKAVHVVSGRKGEFVAVNVAGLDDQMFSDTLFGHTRGAFSGADQNREGLLARACEGTIFLDEIGDLSELSQTKLLRLLQEGEFYPLGADFPTRTNARIVVATHRELLSLVESNTFRLDLYYRLFAHQIISPPLRERPDDIVLLLEHFLQEAATALGKKKPTPPPELSTYLAAYSFPGNIRELKAMVFDAVARHTGGILSMDSFLAIMGNKREHSPPALIDDVQVVLRDNSGERMPTLKDAEQVLIAQAMKLAKGNQGVAAKFLGINRSALNKKLLKLRDEEN